MRHRLVLATLLLAAPLPAIVAQTPDTTVRLVVTLDHPDWLYDVDGATYAALGTAGFSPGKLRATTTMPADFESFWRKAIADAQRIPLASQMTRLPQYSTPDVDVYHINFQNNSTTSRLYGMLSVPTKPGKYPATLVVPGAGVRPYFPSVATARRGTTSGCSSASFAPATSSSAFHSSTE